MATKLNKNLTPQEKRLKRQQKRQDMLFDMAVQLDDTLRKPLRTKIEDVGSREEYEDYIRLNKNDPLRKLRSKEQLENDVNEDNDTEREEHKEYEYKNIAASELIDTLMRQEDYDSLDHYLEENPELRKYIQRNYPHYFDVHELQENNNELAYYREHYPQHFIDEITKPIEESPRGELEIVEDKDVVSGRKHSDEKKRIIASGPYSSSRKQIKTAPKGTPKKDRRHEYSGTKGNTYRKKEVNTEQRHDAKDELKKIIS